MLGVLLIATHGLAGDVSPGSGTPAALQAADALLLRPGFLPLPGGVNVLVGYPLLPWLGVVAAGYGFGEVVRLEPGLRRRVMGITGVAMIAAFVILRAWGVYGDPRPVDNAGDSAADRALVRQLYEATTFVALRADDARPGDRGPGGARPREHPRPGRPRPPDASAASRSSITSCNGMSSTGSPCWRAWRGDCRSPGSSRRPLWAHLPRVGRWACRASTPPGPWCSSSSTYRAVGSPGSRRAILEAGCLTFDLNRSTQCGKPGSAAGAASYRVPGGSASL